MDTSVYSSVYGAIYSYVVQVVEVPKPVTSWTPVTAPVVAWTREVEPATEWFVNPDYAPNPYPYDSASHTYDSAIDTYDCVTAGQSPITTAPETGWKEV